MYGGWFEPHARHSVRMTYRHMTYSGGCGPVHKPFAYHAGARRSFPGGDNATPQTAKQRADKGCTIVYLKWRLQIDIPEAQKPRAKTIGSPHNLPHQW